AGPDATTKTSVSWMTSIRRAGSAVVLVVTASVSRVRHGACAHLWGSVHASFTVRSLLQPLRFNFDSYGDRRCSSSTVQQNTKETPDVNTVRRRLAIAGIISLSFVAAACGSDDNSSSATAAPTTVSATP